MRRRSADAAARDVVVENADVRAVFTNRGGVLKSWRLKQYRDAAGQPLELIPQTRARRHAAPFTLSTDDPNAVGDGCASAQLHEQRRTNVSRPGGQQTLTFEYQRRAGLAAEKTFAFDPDKPYVVTLSASRDQ